MKQRHNHNSDKYYTPPRNEARHIDYVARIASYANKDGVKIEFANAESLADGCFLDSHEDGTVVSEEFVSFARRFKRA